jgi:hypothetical protein
LSIPSPVAGLATTKPPSHRRGCIRRRCADMSPEARTTGWRDRVVRRLKKGRLSCQGVPHQTTDEFVDFSSAAAKEEARSRIPDEGKDIGPVPGGQVLEWSWIYSNLGCLYDQTAERREGGAPAESRYPETGRCVRRRLNRRNNHRSQQEAQI